MAKLELASDDAGGSQGRSSLDRKPSPQYLAPDIAMRTADRVARRVRRFGALRLRLRHKEIDMEQMQRRIAAAWAAASAWAAANAQLLLLQAMEVPAASPEPPTLLPTMKGERAGWRRLYQGNRD
jgi:hypothetical protein